MLVLNLGSGNNRIEGTVNVDITKGEGVDEVQDLVQIPWKWEDNSVEGIYLIHTIEHFPNQAEIIKECHRILKKGGFLHIVAPHSSSVMSIGCMGHYRTYSYDTFRDYLSRPFYMFKEKLFETEKQELRWWYGRKTTNVPFWMMCMIIPANYVINRLIKLSPQVFENLWCYWVGGAKEVLWVGRKI